MNKKILLVEDEKAMAQVLRETLESEGFDVDLAVDGEDGLEKFESWKPDLVLLDIMMPKINGRKMLRILREREDGKRVPVIILTNVSGDVEVIADIISQGGLDYFVKANTKMEDIVNRVKSRLYL